MDSISNIMLKPEEPSCEIVSLDATQELRFNMINGQSTIVQVYDGDAFCFGWRLPKTAVTFKDQPFAISTDRGCKVKFSGSYESYYTADSTQLQILNDINSQISTTLVPPVIFVIGAASMGKTTLCKRLVNMIHYSGRIPTYVNADPAFPAFSPQGCIGALPITKPVDNYGFPFTDPLLYFFAFEEVDDKRKELYFGQLEELASHVNSRRKLQSSLDGGVVIDFPAITNDSIFDALVKALKDFDASHVAIIGNDKLYRRVETIIPTIPQLIQSKCQTYKLPQLPGTVRFTKQERYQINASLTRRYFYGDGNPEFFPIIILIDNKNITLNSLGPLTFLSDSLLPINQIAPNPKNPILVSFSSLSPNNILAIITPPLDKTEMWKQNVIGFLSIVDVPDNEHINVLKPNKSELPSTFLIASKLKWDINK